MSKNDKVVKISLGYIVGAAEALRKLYIREGLMSPKAAIRITCPDTGATDIARPKNKKELNDEKMAKAEAEAVRRQIRKAEREKKRAQRSATKKEAA